MLAPTPPPPSLDPAGRVGSPRSPAARRPTQETAVARDAVVRAADEPTATDFPKLAGNESMHSYFNRVRDTLNLDNFNIKARLTDDGFYIHKSTFLAGHMTEALLHQPGTVLNETMLFVKVGDQVASFHFTPEEPGMISKLVEMSPATILRARGPDQNMETFLHIPLPRQDINSHVVVQAVEFAQERKYHPVYNNCVQFVDFMVRVLTRDRVQNAPLLYDLICGTVPAEDHPSLGRLTNLTNRSWLAMVSGEALANEFVNRMASGGGASPRASPGGSPHIVGSPAQGSPLMDRPAAPADADPVGNAGGPPSPSKGDRRRTAGNTSTTSDAAPRAAEGTQSAARRKTSEPSARGKRRQLSHDDMTHLLAFMDIHWHGSNGQRPTEAAAPEGLSKSASEEALQFNDARFWKAELPVDLADVDI